MKRFGMILASLVVVIGLAAAVLFPIAWKDFHADISVAAFGVAGAIVALVLPAAGLGHDAARRVVDSYLDGMAKAMRTADSGDAPLSPSQWAAAGVKHIRSWRTRVAIARLASALVYASFLLAIFSLLQVKDPVPFHIGKQPILPWHLAVAGALACLAVGAVLLLPLAWWFLSARLLDDSETVLKHFASQPVASPTDSPADGAATTPVTPPMTEQQ